MSRQKGTHNPIPSHTKTVRDILPDNVDTPPKKKQKLLKVSTRL
jgi:hypothetical protein